jgi:hypothetical protein
MVGASQLRERSAVLGSEALENGTMARAEQAGLPMLRLCSRPAIRQQNLQQ